jgi:chromosome segregation ATPase
MEAPTSSALPSPMPDVGEVLASLAEISSTNSEFGQFFGGVLDELETLLGQVLGEQKSIELERQGMEQELERRRAEIERQKAEMDSLRRSVLDDIRGEVTRATAASQVLDQRFGDLLASASDERHALRSALGQFQKEMADLAEAKSQVTGLGSELRQALDRLASAQAAAQSEALPAMEERLLRMEEERSQSDRERAALESELETLRTRNAEMACLLDRQKSQATEERTQWGDEIRRLRQVMELMSAGRSGSRAREAGAAPPAAVPPSPAPAGSTAAKDSALDSVIAQFELLQKDAARRRKRSRPADTEPEPGAAP